MNRRDYLIYQDGKAAAARGSGLSDSPYGGRDGDLWRDGLRFWLDEHGDETGELPAAGLDTEKTASQDAPGLTNSTRPL